MSKLLAPARLGGMNLTSKIIMAPLTRSRADPMGVPTPEVLEYYTQRASAGLLITEGTQPSFMGQGYPRTPGIHTEDQIAMWSKITGSVKAKGGKMFMQIMHVGRIWHPDNRQIPDLAVAPSAIAAQGDMFSDKAVGMVPMPAPRALETSEMPALVDEFVTASQNAIRAGFEGVEIHAANGYLLNQFLATNCNQRTDAYGGSVGNRVRIVAEIVEAVSAAIGAEKTGIRISPGHMFNDLVDEKPLETHTELLKAINTADMAYVHLMMANAFADALNNAGDINDLLPTLRPLVKGPLLAAGQLTFTQAEELTAKGLIDFPVFGRPFIANPDLVERFKHGSPLAEPKPEYFYAGGPNGYSDYPALSKY